MGNLITSRLTRTGNLSRLSAGSTDQRYSGLCLRPHRAATSLRLCRNQAYRAGTGSAGIPFPDSTFAPPDAVCLRIERSDGTVQAVNPGTFNAQRRRYRLHLRNGLPTGDHGLARLRASHSTLEATDLVSVLHRGACYRSGAMQTEERSAVTSSPAVRSTDIMEMKGLSRSVEGQ